MKEVYEQVLITCTTINVVIFISTLISWIGFKISDHHRKKKETENQSQENKQ